VFSLAACRPLSDQRPDARWRDPSGAGSAPEGSREDPPCYLINPSIFSTVLLDDAELE